MKKLFRIVLPLAGTMLLMVPAAAQDAVYVLVGEAQIRGGSGFGGPVVAEVSRGTRLQVVEPGRLRVKVRTSSGEEGWIPARQVQDSPPSQGSRLGGLIQEDREVTEMRTASTGRGLVSEEARELAEAENIPQHAIEDQEAAERLAVSIEESDIDSFMRQGGLTQ